MTRQSYISLDNLASAPDAMAVLGYPSATPRQGAARIRELDKLGIRSIALAGPTELGRARVLGKGYAGVVVLAKSAKGRRLALKIRRTDSQRDDMAREAALLEAANAAGVGPRMYMYSKNFLVMEYVQGEKIGDWLGGLGGAGTASRVRRIIKLVLEDCQRLDAAGIDHGEISNISKHVIISSSSTTATTTGRQQQRPVLIDFESASTERRPSNVTSITQAIFISSPIAKKVQRILRGRLPSKNELIVRLREYKERRDMQSFESMLETLRLHRV